MRTLLVDGDILAYAASSATQKTYAWDEETVSVSASLDEALGSVGRTLDKLMDDLNASDYRIALSDPDKNWRKKVLPSYKSNRTGEKPIHYDAVRAELFENGNSTMIEWLEGDDVLGLMSTMDNIKGEKIIVSIDKDMRTIPGLLFSPRDPDVVEISEDEADRYHLYQTLIGDTVDGYKGCPGVGPKAANHVLDNPTRIEAYEYTFTKGPREGLSELRTRVCEPTDVWSAIVSRFEVAQAKGLLDIEDANEAALVQARVARILRSGEYNFKTGKVKLWTPKKD